MLSPPHGERVQAGEKRPSKEERYNGGLPGRKKKSGVPPLKRDDPKKGKGKRGRNQKSTPGQTPKNWKLKDKERDSLLHKGKKIRGKKFERTLVGTTTST